MNIEEVQEKLLVRIHGAIHTHESSDVLALVTAYEKLEMAKEWQRIPEKREYAPQWRDDLLDMPRKTPNDGWITDREPDIGGDYWVTQASTLLPDLLIVTSLRYYTNDDIAEWAQKSTILAWQPLVKPEPYKP